MGHMNISTLNTGCIINSFKFMNKRSNVWKKFFFREYDQRDTLFSMYENDSIRNQMMALARHI